MQQLKDHPFFQSQRNLRPRNIFSRENIVEMRKRNRSAYERKPAQQSQPLVPKLQVTRLETRPQNRSQIMLSSSHSNRKLHSSVTLTRDAAKSTKPPPSKNKKSEFIPLTFKPKLLKKTLQDNPLILGSILKKKLRIMERQDIDRYLTSIIKPQNR